MQDKYSKALDKSQVEVLTDKSVTGREKPWREKKLASEYLAMVFKDFNPQKAFRVRSCGDLLLFGVFEDGSKRLKQGNFCRARLCPMCAWRRSLKIYANTVKILDKVGDECVYLFLTLTVKNCTGVELSRTLDVMFRAWSNMTKRQVFRKAVKGWYRGLEVTHNVDHRSPSYDTYHPHFHTLLAVNKSYFKKSDYLTKADWAEVWQQSLGVDYEPVVDVRRVKGSTSKAVAEAAKYTVKDADYIIPEDWELTVETVRTLDRALDRRRLVAYGGLFKALHKQLNLDDEVDGDLVNVREKVPASKLVREDVYFWHVGYRQYVKRTC